MYALATRAHDQASVAVGPRPGHRQPSLTPELRPAGVTAVRPPSRDLAQAGFFDDLLGAAGPGLLGAAGSFLSGDSKGAIGQLRETGAAAAPMLAQHGASALGGMIGGQVGQTVSSLGAPLGQGLSGVISGESTPGQAAGGVLSAAQPGILSLIMSLLNR